jgi:hypothetical protein
MQLFKIKALKFLSYQILRRGAFLKLCFLNLLMPTSWALAVSQNQEIILAG